MKKIACDSSSIIAISMNCLLWIFEKFNAEFLVPEAVVSEIYYRPLNSRSFSFEAMRNGNYIGRVFKVKKADAVLTRKILDTANNLITIEGRPKVILHRGEAEALALILQYKLPYFLVDERIARLVVEAPEKIAEIIERRLGRKTAVNENALRQLKKWFSGVSVIRSTELVAVAIDKGIISWNYPKKRLLFAALHALKRAGCAITEEEIREIVNYFSRE